MKYFRTLTILIALFVCSVPAHAERYMGLGLGLFELNAGANKQNAFGGYLQLGHDFMPYLGAEIRLGGSSSASTATEKISMDWMVAHFLKPNIELMDGVILYGLGGFTVNHTSFQAAGASKLKKTNVSFSFGIGAQATIADHISVAGEWVRYATESDAGTQTTSFQGLDINGFVGTVKYEF
ncbi:MAG: porin family protein [Mariprofundaceae bacterium]